MKRLVIIIILVPLLSSAEVFAQSAKQYFRAAEDFYKSANFNDAIDQYNKAIELDPDYEKAYVRRAMSYSKTGDHVSAASDFDRALVFNEKDAELFYYSGHEWYLQGKNNEAHAKLSKAISMKGNFLEAYQVRTVVNMELGRYDQALEDCQKCLRLKEDETGYFNLAQVYEKLAMYDDAEQAYLKSISKNSRLLETHYALAHLQFERNKYNAASSSVRQVLQRDPKHLEGILLQSKILSAQGNYPKAVEVLSMASIDYPNEAQIYQIRGGYIRFNEPGGLLNHRLFEGHRNKSQ